MTNFVLPDSPTYPAPRAEDAHGRVRGRRARPEKSGQFTAGRGAVVPSPRATLGALLCVTSGLLVYGAVRQASSPPSTRYAVATHDIAPGHVLGPGDIAYTAVDLPRSVRLGAVGPDTTLDGVTALGPVAKGELFQSGALVRRPRSARLFSFPIDAAFAVGGRLRPGLRVAIYSANDDDAVLVARSALVVRVDDSPQSESLIVTVEIDGATDEQRLVGAASHRKLAIVDAGLGPEDAPATPADDHAATAAGPEATAPADSAGKP